MEVVADDDRAGVRLTADPRCDVDPTAVDVTVLRDGDLSDMHAGAQMKRPSPQPGRLAVRPQVEAQGGTHGCLGARELRHHAIAEQLHDSPSALLDRFLGAIVDDPDDLDRERLVGRREAREADQVCEPDRGESGTCAHGVSCGATREVESLVLHRSVVILPKAVRSSQTLAFPA